MFSYRARPLTQRFFRCFPRMRSYTQTPPNRSNHHNPPDTPKRTHPLFYFLGGIVVCSVGNTIIYRWGREGVVQHFQELQRTVHPQPHNLGTASDLLRKRAREAEYMGIPFHFLRLESNAPCEDFYDYENGAREGGKSSLPAWAVYDGHAGWATSRLLKSTLIPETTAELRSVYKTEPGSVSSLAKAISQDPSAVAPAIKRAFLALDQQIFDQAEKAVRSGAPPANPSVVSLIAPAVAGSCALLSLFNHDSDMLYVACAGDSRAVLGRYDEATGKYIAIPLSKDQTGFNEDEVARITAEHPGETSIIDPNSGRLLGMAITRAFGDHRWKWGEEMVTEIQQKYFGSPPRPQSLTQPYMTAEPVVTETRVQRGGRGDFLILATDGMWDHISSEDAVECVGQWVEAKKSGTLDSLARTAREAERESWEKQPTEGIRGENLLDDLVEQVRKQKLVPTTSGDEPEFWLDAGRYVEWRATPRYFVVEEENAAAHLVKNTFGGSRRNLFCGVMTAYPPISRNVRDDTTVQVIFFGDLQAGKR